MSAFMLSSKTVHEYEDYKMGSYGEMVVQDHMCSVLILNQTRHRGLLNSKMFQCFAVSYNKG
jgi:hypothetical protein